MSIDAWDGAAQALKKLSGELPAMQDVGADVRVALATGSGPLLPANNAFRATVLDDFIKDGDVMYAQFKQENAMEVIMRSSLQIAWSSSRSWLQPERRGQSMTRCNPP